jgi:hypothetical protein
LVNLPIHRSETGKVTDDSDLDKHQEIVASVQEQIRVKGVMSMEKVGDVPVVQRANMLLLFPSIDEQSNETKRQFVGLINSLIRDGFKLSRAHGNYDLSNSQLIYLAARVQQFYESNNDLVTVFRNALNDTILPCFLTRQQIFLLLKTFAHDKAVLDGPKGLNDV